MNFGEAIEMMKKGHRVARTGWNGKGMWLFVIGDCPNSTSDSKGLSSKWFFHDGQNDSYPVCPFIAMKTADNKIVPWLASQTDMLSEDWYVLAP